MSTQHKEIVIVACPRITLGSWSQLAWEIIAHANVWLRATKIQKSLMWVVGTSWNPSPYTGRNTPSPCHVCARHQAFSAPWHLRSPCGSPGLRVTGPPATTLLPGRCGQELPLPCPGSCCNPPWNTPGYVCQDKCPSCPLSPDLDKVIHISAKKGWLLENKDFSMVPAAIRMEKTLRFITWRRAKT